MKRRDFITLLGGAAATWPLAARAQTLPRMRRMGVLMTSPESDTELQARVAAFRQALATFGWTEGRNLKTDLRWEAADPQRARALATSLLGPTPDLIVVGNPIALEAVLQQSRSVPVLFLSMTDPVEMGYVESYARPGGNVTGFTNFEPRTAAKWAQLLKEIAPTTNRAMVMFRGPTRGILAMQRLIEETAPSLELRVDPVEVHDPADIQRAADSFAREQNGGLIVLVGPILAYRADVLAQAARHRLPAIYPYRFYAEEGGLLSYGVDGVDIYRRGASYADRILRGENPGDLPIQAPTRHELVVNQKTARAIGLEVPTSILLRADEVIE